MKRNLRKYAVLALAAVILAGAALLSGVVQASALEATLSETEISGTLPGDINGDGKVDATDLSLLLANYGKPAGAIDPAADINGDGVVDARDLAILLANFGAAAALSNQLIISAVAGKEYDITPSASGVTSFSGMEITVKYDAMVFDLVDLCSFTAAKELTAGPVAGTGITIIQVKSGEIKFTVNKAVPAGSQWTGPLNTIRLRAKTTAVSTVTVEQ